MTKTAIEKFNAKIVKWGPIFQTDDPVCAKPFDHALEDIVQLYRDAGCGKREIREGLRIMIENV